MKKMTIILIILAVIVVAVAAGFGLWQKSVPNENPPGNGQDKEEINTSGWKTYRSEEYGFEVKYPDRWGTPTVTQINGQVIFKNDNCEGMCAIINMEDCGESIMQNNSIARAYTGVGNFGIELKKIFILAENLCAFLYSYDPYIDISEDETLRLLGNINNSRKVLNNSGESVWLNDDEIPQEAIEAYNIFKKVVESFRKNPYNKNKS